MRACDPVPPPRTSPSLPEVPVRIAHLTLDGGIPRFGIGLAVVRLAEAQALAGHEVTVFCREGNAASVAALLPRVRVVPLVRRAGLLGGKRAYLRTIRRALAGGADVLHVHALTRLAHWLLPRRRRRGAALVVTAHASDELGPSASAAGDAPPRHARRHARQVLEVLRRADAVVAPSRWMAGRVEAHAGRTGVVAIPHGPTDPAPVEPRPHAGFRILALSRFVPVKGLDVLIDAVADAFPADADVRLVLAGGGPLEPALRAQAARRGFGDRLEMPGYVEGAARRELLATADVLVVPTLGEYETFGLTAIDGSAAGVPLLVSGGGALPERVERGEGWAVPPGDARALGEALRRLRHDPDMARTAGARGREVVRGLGWSRAAEAHLDVYGSLGAKSAEARPGGGGAK